GIVHVRHISCRSETLGWCSLVFVGPLCIGKQSIGSSTKLKSPPNMSGLRTPGWSLNHLVMSAHRFLFAVQLFEAYIPSIDIGLSSLLSISTNKACPGTISHAFTTSVFT
ncbi:hypothetical protein WG66_011381, partial [Moniliophthora roreri]